MLHYFTLGHVSCGGASWRSPVLMFCGPDLEAEHRARMRDAVNVRSARDGCLQTVHRPCVNICAVLVQGLLPKAERISDSSCFFGSQDTEHMTIWRSFMLRSVDVNAPSGLSENVCWGAFGTKRFFNFFGANYRLCLKSQQGRAIS